MKPSTKPKHLHKYCVLVEHVSGSDKLYSVVQAYKSRPVAAARHATRKFIREITQGEPTSVFVYSNCMTKKYQIKRKEGQRHLRSFTIEAMDTSKEEHAEMMDHVRSHLKSQSKFKKVIDTKIALD